MPDINGTLAQFGDAVSGMGQILGRDHGLDAGESEGLAGVDAADAGMSQGTAQDAAVQQTGQDVAASS